MDRKFVFSFALGLALILFILAPGFNALIVNAQDPESGICPKPISEIWNLKGNCGIKPAKHFLGTTDNKPLLVRTNNAERMRIEASGNVGIGTNSPSANLSILKSGGVQPNVQGVPTGLKVGTPSGTIPLALRQNAAEAATPALAFFETGDGDLGSIGANPSTFLLLAAAGKSMALGVNGSARAVTIDKDSKVGIGTTQPYARLTVQVPDTSGGSVILSATNATDQNLFSVYGNGEIAVGHLLNAPVNRHVCLNGNVLSECNATAQYVPALDDGSGFPQAAQVVSVGATLTNAHMDAQNPFAVYKTPVPCDPNLFGIIGNLDSGADGVKLGEHYLPLALSGVLPVMVTMESGFIRRGDPLTSSSKPGFAMKAIGACKTIGYALEDANVQGTIRVFVHLSENAAPHVAALQVRLKELEQRNALLEARLATLERALQVQMSPADNRNAAVFMSR